jgi:hypothetical protein
VVDKEKFMGKIHTKRSSNSPKGSKIIRISCKEEIYQNAISDHDKFKSLLNQHIKDYPELFPSDISSGYSLHGKSKKSKKLDGLQFQKIKLTKAKTVYSIYPSFVMPNLIAYTKDVKDGIMLRKHDVPYSTLVYLYGRNEMFWYRAEQAFGRNSIVGTTVKKKKNSPKT